MGSLNPQESNINSSPTDMPSALDPVEFRRQGHMMVDFIADYYQNIEKYPVLSQVEPGYLRKCLPESAPDNPEPIESILQDVQNHIVPGLTHWQSPSFFAYFASNVSIAGFLGEMLCTGFNVVGFSWVSSPAVTELESIVMDWLGNLLTLPKSFLFSGNGGGVIHGSTCEAIICTMVAARDQMLRQIGLDNMQKLVVYGSDQTHSALQKACQIVGINPNNFRVIKTTKSTSFALSPESLKLATSSDVEAGLVPLFLCATVGTTATAAVDPLDSLCQVAKYYGIWVHVDAAYAGSACICPEFRHIIDGVEGANSFSLNAHKWLFTALDCCCVWIKDPSTLTSSLSTNPEFLRNKATDSKQVVDYKDWQIALSRRFRAMKLWLVLKSYGAVNIRNFLRSHVKMATLFERLVSTDRRFEVVVPRVFSMVCFRVSPSAAIIISDDEINVENRINELNRKLLEGINASGHAFMTHAVVGGMYVIRCAIGVTLTEEKHIAMAWKLVQEHADAILTKNNIYDQSQNVECVKNM